MIFTGKNNENGGEQKRTAGCEGCEKNLLARHLPTCPWNSKKAEVYPISTALENDLRGQLQKSPSGEAIAKKIMSYVGETEHQGLEGFEDEMNAMLGAAKRLERANSREDSDEAMEAFAEFQTEMLRFGAKFMADFSRTL